MMTSRTRFCSSSSTPWMVKRHAGLPGRRHQDRGDDAGQQRDVDAGRVCASCRSGVGSLIFGAPCSRRCRMTSSTKKTASTMPPTNSVSRQRLRGRPEEIDAAQEADEQRRIAERRQRAADIGDQEDEEDDDMGVERPVVVGADDRPDHDHRGAGRADDRGKQRADQQQPGIDRRRAVDVAARSGCRPKW